VAARRLPERIRPLYFTQFEPRIRAAVELANPVVNTRPRWLGPPPDGLLFARRKLRRIRPEVVIVAYAWMTDALESLDSSVLKMVLTVDLLHERVRSFERLGMPPDGYLLSPDMEARMLGKAQVIVAIQDEEAQAFQRMLPDREVLTLPLPVVPQECGGRQIPGRILFVGSQASHNVEGLQWVLEEVWPTVVQAVPWAELHVCGEVCSRVGGLFPKVRFLGAVPNLGPEYAAAEVCLVPCTVGSGLKIKLIEALSFGRACVATRIGLQGLMELAGTAVALGDTPQEFGNAMCEILMKPSIRMAMEKAALDYVAARLSPEAVCQPFLERIARHVATRARLSQAAPTATRDPRQDEA